MEKLAKVLKIALPVVGEMLLYMLVWVVDTAFVGKWGGDNAVSAVGFSSEIIYTTANVFIAIGISVGITTMVAQKIGAGNKDKAEEYLTQGFIIGSIISVIVTAILILFAHPILKFTGCKSQVLESGTMFMRIASIGAFFNMISSMLNSGLRGTGNTIIPLFVSVIINIVTIVLDWILIFGRFGLKPMGIKGSAIATTTAYFCGFLFLLYYYKMHSEFKVRRKYIKQINKTYMKRIIHLAIPSGLQEAAISGSRIITLTFIMNLGVIAFSANQITTTIESLSFMPGWGFAAAATTLVGQKIGAKEYKTAREYGFFAAIFGICLMLVCSMIFILIPDVLMRAFISNKETIEIGRKCLMIAAIEQPFMGASMIMEGALKGSGDTKSPFVLSIISSWLIRVPLAYYFLFVLKLDVAYAWIAMVIQWAFEGIGAYCLFTRKSKKWVLTGESN